MNNLLIGVQSGDSGGSSATGETPQERLLRSTAFASKSVALGAEISKLDALISAKTMQKYGKAHPALFAWLTARPSERVRSERKSTTLMIDYKKSKFNYI